MSRWSCKSGLGALGEDCAVAYNLVEEYSFEAVRVGKNITNDLMLLMFFAVCGLKYVQLNPAECACC